MLTQKTNAQTTDTNRVDTISMAHIDSVAASSAQNTESAGYDNEDDGYVDTTVKHIYDTSKLFFNWKEYKDAAYTKEKIAQRYLIDKEVNELKQQDDFWYIPAIEKLEKRLKNDPKFRDSLLYKEEHELTDDNEKDFTQQSWFNSLIWCIIIGVFIAAIIYFLSQNKINLFSRESAAASDDTINEEHENIFQMSYGELIRKAEKEQNYRLAIRLMFLQTLKLLSDTNNIHYQPDYTNLHYLQQLNQSRLYNDFFKVMHSYEYAWYGKFNIPADRYALIKNDFLIFQHKIT